jgi:hypothetical protein
VTATVTIDVAGGSMGGAQRYRRELYQYLERSARTDVKIIGARRHLGPGWLLGREAAAVRRSRRIALNNVGFVTPGGQRWTLLANALHFLGEAEAAQLDPSLRAMADRQALVVRHAARRSDVLIAPSTTMAERVTRILPDVADRLTTRLHPITPLPAPRQPDQEVILCPVIFESYKHMPERLADWLAAVDPESLGSLRLLVTASRDEVPAQVACDPRIEFLGRLHVDVLQDLWTRSRAVYFPPGLESFGCPLAEARVNGLPVIARDTVHNREIAGPALCAYTSGDLDSLRQAIEFALKTEVPPDPAPFDPDSYFSWMLGAAR